MQTRHFNLYDVERWRGWRTWLLFPATVCLLVTVLTPLLRSGQGSNTSLFSLMGAFLYALAASFWTRQRFSWIAVEDDNLVVRLLLTRYRVPLADVRNARVVRLGSRFSRPDRIRLLPRPARRWLDREAVLLRLESEATVLNRLRRMLGPRSVDGKDLIVPVTDPQGLVDAITAHRPEPPPPKAGQRRSRRRR
jgi:hypothetical protein